MGRELLRFAAAEGLPAPAVLPSPEGARGRLLVTVDAAEPDAVALCARLGGVHHILRPLDRFTLTPDGGLAQIAARAELLRVPELEVDGLPTFRATSERTGTHPFTSEDVQRAVGGAVHRNHRCGVKMKGFDVELRADVRGDRCNIGVALTRGSLARRVDRPFRPRISLGAQVAWALLELTRPPELPAAVGVVDPFCGSGGLLIEAGRRWPGASLFGSDTHPACAAGAFENLQHLGLGDRARTQEGDARRADLLWAGAPVDTWVSNLPFGLRLGKRIHFYWMFRDALAAGARLLPPGGRAGLLVGHHKELRAALADGGLFRPLHIRFLEMGGAWPCAFVLERLDTPAPPRTDEP